MVGLRRWLWKAVTFADAVAALAIEAAALVAEPAIVATVF